MLSDRIKEIGLKKTDLANYLQISRQTLYRFIEYYENGDFNQVNPIVIKLFKYIESEPLIGPTNVISYILDNLVLVKEMSNSDQNIKINTIKKFLIDNPNSFKSSFIELIVKRKDFDLIIEYLMEIYPLLRKRKLTDSEINKLSLYDFIINKLESEEK